MFSNVTILLQGIIHPNVSIYNTLKTYTSLCPVILSIYKTDIPNISSLIPKFPNLTIISNDLEEYANLPIMFDPLIDHYPLSTAQRMYFQICTTKKGLEHVNTQFVIKSRIDHFYENIKVFIEHGIITQKIISSSIFVRGCQDENILNRCKYCLSDCLFMGPTQEIQKCFDLCYNAKLLTRPETGIWKPYFLHYFSQKNIDIDNISIDEYITEMSKIVDIICINDIGPYNIKLWDKTFSYIPDSLKTTSQYLLKGCDF